MEERCIDDLARRAATGNRRELLGGIAAALVAALARALTVNAQGEGLVVLGGSCAASDDCRPNPGPGGPQATFCADNGFTSDGPLHCCLDAGSCCASDADCCGDLRCFQWPDVCAICAMPPFPTRSLGQPCILNSDCIPYPPGTHCVDSRCVYPTEPSPDLRPLSDIETALTAAEQLSQLEVAGQFELLYEDMHPDAQRFIPREVVEGWYEAEFAPRGPAVAEILKVRSVSWAWEVTGQTYPQTAEVAYRQHFADGSDERGEVRLVKDRDGNWSWFFGRDRAFVDEQIARYEPS